jgi:hypothetical protein
VPLTQRHGEDESTLGESAHTSAVSSSIRLVRGIYPQGKPARFPGVRPTRLAGAHPRAFVPKREVIMAKRLPGLDGPGRPGEGLA